MLLLTLGTDRANPLFDLSEWDENDGASTSKLQKALFQVVLIPHCSHLTENQCQQEIYLYPDCVFFNLNPYYSLTIVLPVETELPNY